MDTSQIEYIDAKTIVRNCKPLWNYLYFNYAIDIYRGCNHGCIYCYARCDYYEKTNNFDNIRVKKNALEIIEKELVHKRKTGVVITGGMSDPYNAYEKELGLLRGALKIFLKHGFGACVITKSKLVARDFDLYLDIQKKAPVTINFSITTANDELAAKIEPFAPSSSIRFKALEFMAKSGLTTSVLIDPMIPDITDTEENIKTLIKKAKDHGASYIYMGTEVTMSDGQREYFLNKAEKIFPGYSQKFLDRYGTYYHCRVTKAKQLLDVFFQTCEKEKIQCSMETVNRKLWNKYYNPLTLFPDETFSNL